MTDLFKMTAIEIYEETVKKRVPDISNYELELAKLAFEAGFNVGVYKLLPDNAKEDILLRLSK
ncbi:MAG: hypothetical protein ACQEV7_16370 [Bacillota bacterium]